jgi:hypothetical protein
MLVLLLVLGITAARATLENIRFADYVAYGKSADGSAPITLSSETTAIGMLTGCRTDIFAPGMRLQILRLGQTNPSQDYDNWYRAIQAAQDYTSGAIRCAPFRGDSWVRGASIAQAIAEEPRQLSMLMQMASFLNPVERSQLMARLSLWSKVSSQTQTLSSIFISKDVDVILRYGDRHTIAVLLHSRSESIRNLAASTLVKMPDDRKKAISEMNIQ